MGSAFNIDGCKKGKRSAREKYLMQCKVDLRTND